MIEVLFFANFLVVCWYTVTKMELLHTLYGSVQLSIVAFFTYTFIFIIWVNKMVDIVTNRMFDTFNKFAPRDTPQNDSLSTLTTLKRYTSEQKQKKSLLREAELKAKESQLYDIKENTPQVVSSKPRPLMGLSCSCTPSTKESLVNKTAKQLALKNILNYQPTYKNYGFLQRHFSHFHQVYELKKFEYPQVAGTVLKDERLKSAIEKAAIRQFQDCDESDDEIYQRLLKNHEKRARKLLNDMRSTLSDFLLRFTSWVLYKLLPMFLSSVVVHSGQVEMLKAAGNSGLPLIFLPLHRSHLDYILISFILLNNNVRSPLVAAGDNLRIPFFGSLLRGLGAFFIKRRIDPIMGRKDYVYKAVLHTYMNECLRAGHNIEFFLEGGRTRTGKPCMPKYGILSVIVDAFIDGTIEDALLVPVSVNYEKLVDGNFIREQLGQPKEMETFGAAIKGIWHVLRSNYGMMRIDFNQPFSMRELVRTFNTNLKVQSNAPKKLISNPSTTSLYGTDVVSDEHKTLVESISKHVLYDCAKSTAVMSTNAIAFLLLYRFRNGVTIEHLVGALEELKTELRTSGRDIGFTGNSLDVINYAVDMLGPGLVRTEKINNEEVIKPVAMLPNVIELTYYGNTLVTYYALESIVAMAVCMLTENSKTLEQEVLVQTISDLCSVFQYEFILCKPCQSLESTILDCVENLMLRKEILICKNDLINKNRYIEEEFDEESEMRNDTTGIIYELNTKAPVMEHINFLRGLLMPLLESYCVTALCLDKLVGKTLLENELVKEVLDEIKIQLSNGSLTYEESVSVDPVKNALKLYQKWQILECHTENKLRLFYLKESEDNSESVRLLYNRINKYRNSLNDEI